MLGKGEIGGRGRRKRKGQIEELTKIMLELLKDIKAQKLVTGFPLHFNQLYSTIKLSAILLFLLLSVDSAR